MTFTYTWANPDSTYLKRVDAQGVAWYIPADHDNRDYAAFLASGETAADYVAPPEPAPLTAEQKLAKSGLTVEELKTLLGI